MIIYVVKKDDTLSKIANMYDVTIKSIVDINMINIQDTLVIGQTLVIIIEDTREKLGNIATNGYLYPNIDNAILEKTLPYLTFVSIFTYGFTSEAELIIPDDSNALEIISKSQTKPLLLISTLGSDGKFSNELANMLLNSQNLQDILLNSLLEVMIEKNYFGLDIDFEYVLPEDTEVFVSFVDKATIFMNNNGYPVFTSLAPKVSKEQEGLLYEAHDYEKIGENSNFALLMTYEWGYTYGPPMAVSPINSVRKVLDYAVTEIPPAKIFMGIPNYGYDWTLPYMKGETKARSIGNVEAVNIARENNAEIKYDDISQSPYFSYYDKDKIEHIVWFEDARSIETKLRTAFEYNFSGVSYWNIMRFFPQNWVVLEQLFYIIKL